MSELLDHIDAILTGDKSTQEELEEGKRLLEKYRDTSNELGARQDEVVAIHYIAKMELKLGESRRAEDSALLALEIYRELRYKEGEIMVLDLLGRITNNYQYIEEAFGIACEIGNDELMHSTAHNLGMIIGIGPFSRNDPHGDGITIDEWEQAADQYEGDKGEDGRPHGQGRMRFANSGDCYEGVWQDGVMNGHGTYFFSNGDRLEGEFVRGFTQGIAKLYLHTGEIIEGEWVKGRMEGKATHSWQGKISMETIADRGELVLSIERESI